MEEALSLINDYGILTIDPTKIKQLEEYSHDVKVICSSFDSYIDRAQRNPITGKIKQFKQIYAFDIYIPVHKKYVGEGIDWSTLNSYANSDVYHRLNILKGVKSISPASLNSSVLEWNQLKRHHCTYSNIEDSLKSGVFCQHCTFPKKEDNYSDIPAKISTIESRLDELLQEFEKSTLNEIRTYRDNVQFLPKGDKAIIQEILDKKALPDIVSSKTISAINKLFKEITIREVDRETIINRLFPNQQMVSLEELKKRFFELEAELKGSSDESELRISLK